MFDILDIVIFLLLFVDILLIKIINICKIIHNKDHRPLQIEIIFHIQQYILDILITIMQPQFACRKQFDTVGLPSVIAKKVQGLVNVLNQPIVDIRKLKAFLAEGIPDEAAILREYCWKIILGYLPQDKSEWDEKVKKHDATYQQFVKLFLPEDRFPDFPLIMNKKHERWTELEEDFNLWEQIEKDTSRTHAQLSFFATPAPPIMIPFFTSPRREKFKLINGEDELKYKEFIANKQLQRKTYRYDYMSRILYVYAKLNPKILYVQGMNEILAPIFYLVNVGKSPGSPVQQSSCFLMFNNAITDIIQLHIKDLDKSQNGIHGKLNAINQMLVVIEPRIWSRLQKLKIDPFYYCFRWMTLLFAQDFALFDTLRIWESIFSSQNRMLFMSYFAISIIIASKKVILNNDFVQVLGYLQNIGETLNVNDALSLANQLYFEFEGHNFKQHSKMTKQALKKKQQKQLKREKEGGTKKVISKWTNYIKNLWE